MKEKRIIENMATLSIIGVHHIFLPYKLLLGSTSFLIQLIVYKSIGRHSHMLTLQISCPFLPESHLPWKTPSIDEPKYYKGEPCPLLLSHTNFLFISDNRSMESLSWVRVGYFLTNPPLDYNKVKAQINTATNTDFSWTLINKQVIRASVGSDYWPSRDLCTSCMKLTRGTQHGRNRILLPLRSSLIRKPLTSV